MRRRHDLLVAEQDIRGRRLFLEHVERGAGDMSGVERRLQRLLVDQPAAGAIDDARALLHLGDGFRGKDVLGLGRHRHMQGDEIGPRQKIVEFDLLDAKIQRPLGRQIRIVSDDAHLQALGAVGDDRADVACADQAQHLAGDLHAHEAVLFPLAGLGRGIRRGQLARQRQHQRDRVLRRGDRVAERRVHHDHAGRRGGGNIDIVDADAGATDDFEVLGRLDDVGGDLGRRADRDAVILVDDLEQFFLGKAGLYIGLDTALLEDGDGGGRQLVGNEDFRHEV